MFAHFQASVPLGFGEVTQGEAAEIFFPMKRSHEILAGSSDLFLFGFSEPLLFKRGAVSEDSGSKSFV